MNILVVEDEGKLAQALRKGLEADHYSVSIARTGEEGFYLATTRTYDLVILDVMLPLRDGIEILKSMRQRGMSVPVLMLTARDTVEDRVRGLDSGADDYMVKPFAIPELLARIRVLTRRNKSEAQVQMKMADLEMNVGTHSVSRAGKPISLTALEFDLLEYFFRHQGRIVSREMLARDVWKETTRYSPLDNVIDVHMGRLRRKIDEPFEKKLLHTVRGVGFTLREKAP